MKAFLAFCVALVLVAAASAMPVEDAYVTRKPSSRVDPVFEIIDSGTGSDAAVIVARKAVFEPYLATVLQTSPERPRMIVFLINGSSLDELGGPGVVASPIADIIEQKGIRAACIVSCDDCVAVASMLAQSLEQISALVLMSGTPVPSIPITKPVFFATNPGASLSGSIDSAMRIVELAPSFRRERRGLGYTLEY